MTTITLTREFSGFANVKDIWIIGSDDSKAGTIGVYELPDGYSVSEDHSGELQIWDPSDSRCEIIANKATGLPQLFSGAEIAPVLKAVEVPPDTVIKWLADVKTAGLASTAKEAALLIGVTEKTMSQFKRHGIKGDASYRTALAMAASLAGLKPYE